MIDEKTRRVKGRLQQSKSKLDTLLNITNAINGNSSRLTLFNILSEVLTDNLGIVKFALFTNNSKGWDLALFRGVNKGLCSKIDIEVLISDFKDIGIISESSKSKHLNSFDMVVPVFNKEKPVAYMVLADVEGEKIEISPIIKHLRFIQTLINIITVALENKRLNKEQIRQAAIQKELELAQDMQTLLFPRELPNNKSIAVKTLYLPHSEVGGDYYDVIPLKNNKTAICIADVSGKGISAALLMANFQANLRALIQVSSNIEDLVLKCNKKIIESANYEKFITLFVAIFDPKKETLTYINSGHQPALLIQGRNTKLLENGSTVLGMFDELPALSSQTIKLTKKTKLICYTDGLAELEDKNGVQLEAEGIRDLLQKETSLDDINKKLLDTIKELEDLSGLEDDITFLAAEFLR